MNNTRWEGSSFVSTCASLLSTTFYATTSRADARNPVERVTMANSPNKNTTEQEMETTMLDNDDDITVATAMTAIKTDFIGQEMADHNIRFKNHYRKVVKPMMPTSNSMPNSSRYSPKHLTIPIFVFMTTKIKRLRILPRKMQGYNILRQSFQPSYG